MLGIIHHPPPKEVSQQQIKSMLADAAQILQQAVNPPVPVTPVSAVPVPMSAPTAPPAAASVLTSPQNQSGSPVAQGTPVSLAALSAQIDALRAMARDHEVKMIEVDAEVTKAIESGDTIRALLDSGATHAVVPYSQAQDMKGLERVSVTLAGDSKEEWFKTNRGTLVVPPPPPGPSTSSRQQTILPLGALVQTLGCKVTWSKRKGLRVVHPILGALKTGISPNTCPYIQEDQALKLIGELEAERLKEFERSVQAMEADLKQLSEPCDPTESLVRFCTTGERADLLRAVFSQPYLQDVPEAIKARLCDSHIGLSEQDGWKILKRLPLCRARRRALHSSKRWVVSLASGPPLPGDPIQTWCHERNLQYLPIDVLEKGGLGWDLTHPAGAWSVLLWAACTGRIVAVLSSPPHQTWSSNGVSSRARSSDNLWGLFEPGEPGFKESMMAIQDMFLWSLASAARGSAIPFLKELPALGVGATVGTRSGLNPGSFWHTDAWLSFSRWSKVEMIEFCQGSLGHSWLHPTTIATNLPLRHLAGLPKVGTPQPVREGKGHKATGWSIGFGKELLEALGGRVKGPSVDELDKVIARALRSQSDSSADDSESLESSLTLTAPSSSSGQVVVGAEEPADMTVGALTAVQREEWRAHILRGHLPYRRDCKFCVEGSGLGVQHRRIKNPQPFTLSVDLFGPMTGEERGRDEQSVSGNPHLKYGLVAVYRLPKSCIKPIDKPPGPDEQSGDTLGLQSTAQPDGELDELAEYEPSLPAEGPEGDMRFPELDDPLESLDHAERALDASAAASDAAAPEESWICDDELDEQLKDLTSGVELLTLRYVVGLKSKTGSDVTTGIQKVILMINKLYPVKVLQAAARELLKRENVEVLPAKGVFTVKPGKPFRRKVRVVSCGNYAKSVAEDVLYASGAPAETLRAALVYAGSCRRQCWSTDVKCAFLLAPIPTTVSKQYVLRPPTILVTLGICTPDEYWQVCRAVYGFKEAPKWWSQYRDQELAKAEFETSQGPATLQRTISDENLWEISLGSGTIIGHILVHVDDLLILGSRDTAESFHRWVRGKWGCSDLDKASPHRPLRFLGVDIFEVCDDHGVRGYSLSQEGYIDELIRSHALEPSARAVIPLPREWVKDLPPEETDYEESVLREAQRISGELLWVSQRSRVDVAFSIGLMSSWAVRSPSFVVRIGLRVLSYLANTKSYRLSLVPDNTNELSLYSDASFAPYGERSISGIVILLGGRCVYWKSRRQTLMSLSTAECELIAACETVTLGQAVESLATDLYRTEVTKVLHVDNLAAITLAEGSGSQRTRHLRVRAYFLKELIDDKKLTVVHCPGEYQRADALTKALPAPRLRTLSELLGIGEPNLTVDPVVNAVMSTSTVFQGVDPNEGHSMMLVLALLMMQVTPAASQEEDEDPYEGISLDLWIVGSLLAFLLLIIWETGKSCVGRCCTSRTPASVRALSADDAQRFKRERRQEAVRRALEKETTEGLRRRNLAASSEEADEPSTPPCVTGGASSSSHVHVHVTPSGVAPSTAGSVPPPPPSLPPTSPRVWTFPASSTYAPVPPPPPSSDTHADVRNRSEADHRTSREVAVQTSGPTGLTDQELCEIELTTSSARTPGVLHIFPECHVLRTVSNTHRRTICRYCLMTLRQRGLRG